MVGPIFTGRKRLNFNRCSRNAEANQAGLHGARFYGRSAFQVHQTGIVIQAVGLTFGAMAVMLFLYKTRIVKVTKGFRLGIIIAIGAVFLTYLMTFILGLIGVNVSMFSDSSNFSIGFSLVVVGIAAFSLMLDFDMMEKGAERRLPKYMEGYTAFGLMITLVWLYLEILKLLGKMRGRN